MTVESAKQSMRTFYGSLNKFVRWFLWGAIALLGAFVALMAVIAFVPDSFIPAPPATQALRGIRTVLLLTVTDKNAESCGINFREIELAATEAIGQSSFRIIERPGDPDGLLYFSVSGATAKDRCVLLVQWALSGEVLTKQGRREAYATLDSNVTMIEFPRVEIAGGKTAVLGFIQRDMRALTGRWSEVNARR